MSVVPVERCFVHLGNRLACNKHSAHGLKSRVMRNVQTPPLQPVPFRDTSTVSPVRVTSHPKSPPSKTGVAPT